MFASPLVKDPSTYADKEWDFIIAGGGTAGCVLASRLSEDAGVKVLVLEAGLTNEDQIFSQVPAIWSKNFRTPADWEYYTKPQKTMNNREVYWPRGKLLGGSSSINAMVYTHCAPSDFDEWARAGATGWSYQDLQPYFRKAEKYTPHALHSDVNISNRGTGGIWHTGHPARIPVNDDVIASTKTVGINYTPDFNAPPQGLLGVNHFSGFIDANGRRSSAATAYLTPDVLARPNLTVAIETLTTKVVFETKDGKPKAVGVEVASKKGGQTWTVKSKEVIICAGAINTPQLLLLSGLGPKAHLESLKIPVVADLPLVGQKMKDHLLAIVSLRAKPGVTLDYLNTEGGVNAPMKQWIEQGNGDLAGMIPSGGAFMRADNEKLPYTGKSGGPTPVVDATSGPDAPDIEILWANIAHLRQGLDLPPAESPNVMSLGPIGLRPQSEGSIQLRSTDPWEKPLIDANYYSTESDLNVMVRGVRLCLRIARTEPFASKLELKDHSDDEQSIFFPGDADPDKVTDDQLKRWLREKSETVYHPVGTARIGKDASDSVIGPTLRVHGIAGLRVLDASVFPEQLSAHPTAPIIAMAEKASDMIKAELKA